VGAGFSPLDEELGLLPGPWSPHLQEHLARLGARLPFAQAAEEFTAFTQVPVSEATVRRHTEAAGAAYVAVQTAEVERLEQAARALSPPPATVPEPPAPDVLQVSVDGAFVPLVGGEWAEVKTLAIGEVVQQPDPAEPPALVAHATRLSYFSRLADAETFTRLATAEVHRRGVGRARVVAAPLDGAEWAQGFLDVHRPDAVRILDFPHAAEYLTNAAQAVWGVGTAATNAWAAEQRHLLKHGSATTVLTALAQLPGHEAADLAAAAEARDTALGYLGKRLDQLQYATFRARGYPIGSGCVESANKLVVEARLKGSGRHWARAHLNPLVALRTALCSGRWREAWGHIAAHRRTQLQRQRRQRQLTHRAAHQPPPPAVTSPARPVPPPRSLRPPRSINGRPTADHPWRRPLLAGGRRFAATHPKL
jgi:hypothetical protein